MTPTRPGLAALAAAAFWVCQARADDPKQDEGLTLADLAPYRAAIEGKPAAEAVAVTFRALWDHPERYQGRRVRVEGRVARRFRQEAFGTFPPLAEAWAVSPTGDPFCLVYPLPKGPDRDGDGGIGPDPSPGASVRFEGTFLRRLRYRGGDSARLAPLIVGDRAPVVTSPAPAAPARTADPPAGRRDRSDWLIGLAAAGLIALALARQHLRGPSRGPARGNPDADPPPEFVDQA